MITQAQSRLTQIYSEEDLHLLADPSLGSNYNPKELLRVIDIAARCICQCSRMRPKMGQVYNVM